jgi:hypothetical protein
LYILDENNIAVDLNLIPEQADIHFWVYQNSVKKEEADYYCQPLIMLESFYAATLKLRFDLSLGRKKETYFLNVPADHQILIGESTHGDLEINPVTSISGRGFSAFSLNPMSSFTADYLSVDVEDVYQTTKWFVPKTVPGQLLCIPLCGGYRPPCIYLVRDIPKSLEIINIGNAI